MKRSKTKTRKKKKEKYIVNYRNQVHRWPRIDSNRERKNKTNQSYFLPWKSSRNRSKMNIFQARLENTSIEKKYCFAEIEKMNSMNKKYRNTFDTTDDQSTDITERKRERHRERSMTMM